MSGERAAAGKNRDFYFWLVFWLGVNVLQASCLRFCNPDPAPLRLSMLPMVMAPPQLARSHCL